MKLYPESFEIFIRERIDSTETTITDHTVSSLRSKHVLFFFNREGLPFLPVG